jgi:hypothetical protein
LHNLAKREDQKLFIHIIRRIQIENCLAEAVQKKKQSQQDSSKIRQTDDSREKILVPEMFKKKKDRERYLFREYHNAIGMGRTF